jgi:PAS domain S-box-containing protein
MKFSTKLIASTVTLATLAFCGLSFLTFVTTESLFRKTVQDRLFQSAEETASRINQRLATAHQNLKALSKNGAVQLYLETHSGPYTTQEELLLSPVSPEMLEREIKTQSEPSAWQAVYLVDLKGNVVSPISKKQQTLDQKEIEVKSAYEQALKGDDYITDAFYSEFIQAPTLVFAFPVRLENVRKSPVRGVMVGYLSWPWLLSAAEKKNVTLFNQEGLIIARSVESSTPLFEAKVESVSAKAILTGKESSIGVYKQEDKKWVGIALLLQELNEFKSKKWGLIEQTEYSKAFSPIRSLGARLFMPAIGILFASAFVTLLISKAFSYPLQAMIRKIEPILKKAEISLSNGNDEFAILEMGVNKAIERHRQALTDLAKEVLLQETASLERKEAEDRFDALAQFIQEGVCLIDSKGFCTLANPAAVEILGYSEDELKKEILHKLTHSKRANGEFYPVTDCLLHNALAEAQPIENQSDVFWNKDGKPLNVIYSMKSVYREQKLIGKLILFRDVRIEDQVQKLKAQLDSLLLSSPDAIIGQNMAGMVTIWNKAAEKLLGFTADEMMGQSVMKIIPENQPQEAFQILDWVWSGKLIEGIKVTRKHKNGQFIEVLISVVPIRSADEKIIGASTVLRSIVNSQKFGEKSFQQV